MRLPRELSTARLHLRRPRVADAEAVFAGYACDPDVTRYLKWRPHRDPGETRAYLAGAAAAWPHGPARTYAIDVDGSPAVGALELRPDPAEGAVTFGYVLARPLWGRGLMTEALAAAAEWCLGDGGAWRFWGFCDVDNPASARVMEKAGLSFEGVLRRWSRHPNVDPDRPRDCRCYARVR